ncbi:MAG: DUF808 family protein [Enterobacteriaceae bacterium]
MRANRELPVVWGVAKGSLINVIPPLALLISAFIPWAIAAADAGARFCVLKASRAVLHSPQAHKHKEDPQVRQRWLEAREPDPMAFERIK